MHHGCFVEKMCSKNARTKTKGVVESIKKGSHPSGQKRFIKCCMKEDRSSGRQ